MVETRKSKANLKRKNNTDTISKGKMQLKVIHHYPEYDPKNVQRIEQQLFEIFKKYE